MDRGHRAAVLLLLAVSMSSCASQAIYDRWKISGNPMTVQLTATQKQPTHVEIQWRARAELPYSPKRSIGFDPVLEGCENVLVLATSSNEVRPAEARGLVVSGFSRDVEGGSLEAWDKIVARSCTVLLVVGRRGLLREPRLHVSTHQSEIGTVKLETERNPWWLTLLPIGAAFDVVRCTIFVALHLRFWLPEDSLCLQYLGERY